MGLPKQEAEDRRRRVQELLAARGLDCALVYYNELYIANGWFLSGWCPQFESGMVLVPREGPAMILGGAESEPFARCDSAITETRNLRIFMVPEEEYPNSEISSFAEVFRELGARRKVARIGVVGMDVVPSGLHRELQGQLGGVELVDLTAEYEAFRRVKSAYEIERIQGAFAMGDRAYEALLPMLRPGVSELELAATVEHAGRRLGANGFGFKTIAATGERSNGCVPTASKNRLRHGDMLLFGYSFRNDGYCSAVGDTLVVGEPSGEQAAMLADLAEAFRLTRDALRVGATGQEIDAPARALFGRKGYLRYLICPFAHTIGLFEAEAPFFGPGSRDVLEEDMTVCVDVSFFNHPVFHGVRVETGYRISPDGPVALSPLLERRILGYRAAANG